MSSYTVNLLPKRKQKVADRLLHFILFYFRYIIIITQIVVISVFFFRFREDQKIIDLKQKFRQKQQILAVTAPIVEEAEMIQSQTTYVKAILDAQDAFLKKLQTVLASIPSDTSLNSLDMSGNIVKLGGVSANVESIRALHRKLVLTKGFETAQINMISQVRSGGYEFVVEIPVQKKNERRTDKKNTK